MDENDRFEVKLITEAEHHFNDLCFKIRALSSTWLLATFGGIGFIATETLNVGISKDGMITLLCIASATGITVLWILDLLIYQQMLNSWFQCRDELHQGLKLSSLVYEKISKTQPKRRAASQIKVYYHVTISAPLLFAIAINLPKSIEWQYDGITYLLISALLIAILNIIVHIKTLETIPKIK